MDDSFEILDPSEEEKNDLNIQFRQQITEFMDSSKEYQLENWYTQLQDYTFKTEFVSLSAGEAQDIYQVFYDSSYQCDKLKFLSLRIDQQLQAGPVFAKLSTRSAKDYAWDFRDPKIFESSVIELTKYLRTLDLTVNQNQKNYGLTLQQGSQIFNFLINLTREQLKISSASQLINIFTHSERIVTDLFNLLVINDLDGKGSQEEQQTKISNICLREWVDFCWEDEYRAFFYNGKLTGICSYDQNCYYWRLQDEGERQGVEKLIREFFDSFKQLLVLSKGVIDFAVCRNKVYLIEINPWGSSSRGSLFDWVKDEQILINGPCEFRYLKEPLNNIFELLPYLLGSIDKGALKVLEKSIQFI